MAVGKHKGSAFERKVCSKLSLWITNGERKDCLWRSAVSGGRSTFRHSKGENVTVQLGDVCSVDPAGHVFTNKFFVECKHYKDLQITSFVTNNAGHLSRFWLKTKQEARKYQRIPMLVAKQNLYPTFVFFTRPALAVLSELDEITRCWFREPQDCIMVMLDDLLKTKPQFSLPPLETPKTRKRLRVVVG